MKKTLLIFLLVSSMLFSTLSFFAFADDPVESDPDGAAIPALSEHRIEATYGTIEIDGKPEAALNVETALQENGSVVVGAAWHNRAEKLYLGILGEKVVWNSGKVSSRENPEVISVKIEIGEYHYEVLSGGTLLSPENSTLIGESAASDDGSFIEVAIPLKAVVAYQNESGKVYAFVKLTVTTDLSTETFEGCILFTLFETVCNSNATGFNGIFATKDANGNYARISKSGYGMSNPLVDDIDNGLLTYKVSHSTTNNGFFRFKLIGKIVSGDPKKLADDQAYRVAFDFEMSENVPITTPTDPETSSGTGNSPLSTEQNGIRALIFFGIGSGGQSIIGENRPWGSSQFIFSVYNTASGLVLYYGDQENAVIGSGILLGKQAGETFKLGFAFTPIDDSQTRFEITVDGVSVGSLTAQKGKVYKFPLYAGTGVALGAASDHVESSGGTGTISYRNVSISTIINTNVAKYVRYSVGNFISEFDEEENINTINGNLQVSHGKITVDGFIGETFTKLDENAKNYIYEDACLVPSTSIGSNVCIGAVWSKNTGKLYFAGFAKTSFFISVQLEISGQVFEFRPNSENIPDGVECAFDTEASIFEAGIPMSGLEFSQLGDSVYGTMKITVHTMIGSDCLNGLMCFTADEFFASQTETKAGFSGFVRNEYTSWPWTANKEHKNPKSIAGGCEFLLESNSEKSLKYSSTSIYNGLNSWVDCSNVYLEMDLNIKDLPVGTPQTFEVVTYDSENPARITMLIGKGLSGSYPAETLLLAIYNTGENGLMMVRDNSKDIPDSSNQMLLNKTVGEPFRLGVRWYENNSVMVYIDGTAVGIFGATAAITERKWNSNGYGLYFAVRGGTSLTSGEEEGTAHVVVTNMSFARAFDLDPDFFMSIAEGNTVTDTTPGGVYYVKPGKNQTPTTGTNEKNTEMTTNEVQSNTPQDSEDTSDPTVKTKKKGCRSSMSSSISVLALLGVVLIGFIKPKKHFNKQ